MPDKEICADRGSAAYKVCVYNTPIYARVHKVLEFVKNSISDFICIQNESLYEHNADGKGRRSRLNLKFISSGEA